MFTSKDKIARMPAKTVAHSASLLLAVVLSALGPALAQQPAFDVVTIKPHPAGDVGMSWGFHDASYQAKNFALKEVLAEAYGIRSGLISGIPKWAEDARFDIEGKVVDPGGAGLAHPTKEQQQAMLASMLADRFQAKVHTETKTLPVYDLVVEKDGPKFKESGSQTPKDGPLKGLCPGCMMTNVEKNRVEEMHAVAMPMSQLIAQLSSELNRTVLDKTNLTGKYDLVLKWLPEDAALSAPADGSATDPGPSIFGALSEQLGLKLLPAKGPVVTLVVDRLEPPSPN